MGGVTWAIRKVRNASLLRDIIPLIIETNVCPVALGTLDSAEESYSQSIGLCIEANEQAEGQGFGVRKCDDLYVLYLNRGSLRLNNGRSKVGTARFPISGVVNRKLI